VRRGLKQPSRCEARVKAAWCYHHHHPALLRVVVHLPTGLSAGVCLCVQVVGRVCGWSDSWQCHWHRPAVNHHSLSWSQLAHCLQTLNGNFLPLPHDAST